MVFWRDGGLRITHGIDLELKQQSVYSEQNVSKPFFPVKFVPCVSKRAVVKGLFRYFFSVVFSPLF